MIVFGLLCMLLPAGIAVLLAWQNRDVVVELRLAGLVWTGHLYAVLIAGALFACWFLLGAAFIHCRIVERRARRRGAGAARVGAGAAARAAGGGPNDTGGGTPPPQRRRYEREPITR